MKLKQCNKIYFLFLLVTFCSLKSCPICEDEKGNVDKPFFYEKPATDDKKTEVSVVKNT
jgi:hypothetical protein